MKKYLSIFSFIFAGLLALTSCDDNAANIEYLPEEGEYTGEMEVSLYTPDNNVEEFLYNMGNEDFCISTKLLPTKVIVKSNEDPRISISALPNEGMEMDFDIKFLDDTDDVLPIYQKGLLARIYYTLREAKERGLLDEAKFNAFADEIRTIKDTLNITGVSTNMLTMTPHGAGLATWDYEKNSMFTDFIMSEQKYTRKSNIFSAFAKLKDEITALAESGFITKGDIDILSGLQEHQANTITDGSGNGVIYYANYQVDAVLYIKNATGLLNVISAALFGYNELGFLNKDVWLILAMRATENFGGRYERVD